MALGDITLFKESAFGGGGSRTYTVSPSATTIKAGEPVLKGLGPTLGTSGGRVVSPAATNTPVVSTDTWAGIAASTSTNTATATGTVEVWPLDDATVYLIAPKVAATWDTQAEYDALVGARVLIDLTSSTYTILATDGSTNGLVIEPLDVSKYPGKVAFKIRSAVSYSA